MKRRAEFERTTKETQIKGSIDLDGSGEAKIQTGIGFFDHMLELFAFHSGFDVTIECKGDLEVCGHHSIEDVGLALGKAFLEALGDKKGINRYGTCFLPMDECLTRTVADLSGRPYHVFRSEPIKGVIGEFPAEMTQHFFYSFCTTAKITLHQEVLYGENDHHKVESLFKGFARSLAEAASKTGGEQIRSTKGVL